MEDGRPAVFHLGGVLNPFPGGPDPAYLTGAADLVRALGGPGAE
jgi:hypothetical protein